MIESGNRPKALITGASSGIGAAFARRFATEGYDLLLVARRKKLLEELCSDLSKNNGIKAEYITAELSDDSDIVKVEKAIKDEPDLEVLVNNAGYGSMIPFQDDDIDSQVNMIKVHDIASMRLVHAALPGMISKRKGTIINVSSAGAFVVGGPHSMIYYASKLFLTSLSETLHVDFRKCGIKVQALCPGLTISDFHKKLGFSPDHPSFKYFKMMTSEQVVEVSLKDLKKGKVICVPGFENKLLVFFARFLPRRIFYWFVTKNMEGMRKRESQGKRLHGKK